jgi:hypothetical protein
MNDVAEIQNDVARVLGGAGPVKPTDIVLTWDEWPSNSTPDAVDGSRTGIPTAGTVTLSGLVHYVQPGMSQVRQFNEVEVGDVIVDFAADAAIDGKENLAFNILGQCYVAKQVSEKLASSWDVAVGNEKIFRTVLLRKAT